MNNQKHEAESDGELDRIIHDRNTTVKRLESEFAIAKKQLEHELELNRLTRGQPVETDQ